MLDILAADQTTASGGLLGSNTIFFLFIALAFGALWLMSSRNRKQQREQEQMRNNLAAGDDVMTASGLFGTVVNADGDVVEVEIADGVRTRWVRQAILKKVDPPVVAEPVAQADPSDDDEDASADEFEVPDDLSSLDDPKRDERD